MAENGRRIMSPLVQLLKPELEEIIEAKDWRMLKDIISDWPAPDIGELISELKPDERIIIFRLLPKSLQSDVFAEFDPGTQEHLLKSLTDEQVKSVISELSPDDRTELFEELPYDLTRMLINMLSTADRREALQLLGYPEDSVGRLMTPDYVAIKPSWSIEQAIQSIRQFGVDAETINMIYVVDDGWHLIDDIPLRRIILGDPKQAVESIMDHHFVCINANADQEEAVKLLEKYDLIALPVIDAEGHLLGIVTIDDVIDVLREEQTEDFTKFVAIESKHVGLDFITRLKEVPLKKLYRSRIVWLVVLLAMDLLTGSIIQGFQGMIARYVVLVTFLPVLIDTAGNAGSQTATLVIRAMALGTVKMADWLYLMGRELLVAALLGVTMGFGISIMGVVRGKSLYIAQIVVITMIINVIVGSIIGLALPFIFTKFKKDPAAASTPLITTLADIIGTGIYLVMAYLFLG